MIDWLNSFSFEEAARLVHPLVVLAVLAAINGAVGYWGLGMALTSENDPDGAAFAGLLGLALAGCGVETVLYGWWWACWGVHGTDGLTLTGGVALATSCAALGLGSLLRTRKTGD